MTRWSDPISKGKIPMEADFNFESPEDEDYIWRVGLPGQYFLCPAVGIYPAFVFPIPQGYRTDGLSIPWFAQGIVKKDSPALPAGYVHDLGCSAELFPVRIVNQIMGMAMTHSPVPVPQKDQKRIQAAVDVFCWMTWYKHKKKHVQEDRDLVLQASIDLWRKHGPLFAGYARIEEISPAFGGSPCPT